MYNNLIQEHEQTKRVLDKQNIDIGEIKKESHKRKKMLAAQQQIIHAGANSYNKVMSIADYPGVIAVNIFHLTVNFDL